MPKEATKPRVSILVRLWHVRVQGWVSNLDAWCPYGLLCAHTPSKPSRYPREASSWAKARRRRLLNVSGMVLITSCFSHSARLQRRPRNLPASPRKTPTHLSVHSLRTCSFLRTGARGSRLKIPMRASVSLSLVPCSSVIRIESCLVGEVGKLLGAKWKELDDTEKKVRYLPRMRISELDLMLQCSHISTKLLVTRREPMRRRLLTMFVNVFSPAPTKPESFL